MRAVDRMTSSKTGTLPPTMPVLPPCGFTAKFLLWQCLGHTQYIHQALPIQPSHRQRAGYQADTCLPNLISFLGLPATGPLPPIPCEEFKGQPTPSCTQRKGGCHGLWGLGRRSMWPNSNTFRAFSWFVRVSDTTCTSTTLAPLIPLL